MSLTEASEVFVAVEETALNDLITAVCTTRPHLLHYGSPAFVPASSTSATQMAPIPFPGSPGLQWSVELTKPLLDLSTEDLPRLENRVKEAISLERAAMCGFVRPSHEVDDLVEELGGCLRAVLRDVLCGHLDPALRKVADELVEQV